MMQQLMNKFFERKDGSIPLFPGKEECLIMDQDVGKFLPSDWWPEAVTDGNVFINCKIKGGSFINCLFINCEIESGILWGKEFGCILYCTSVSSGVRVQNDVERHESQLAEGIICMHT